jgi:hypothetical protein
MQDRNNQWNRSGQNRSSQQGKNGEWTSQPRHSRADAEAAFGKTRDQNYSRNENYNRNLNSASETDQRYFGNESYDANTYSNNNSGNGSYQKSYSNTGEYGLNPLYGNSSASPEDHYSEDYRPYENSAPRNAPREPLYNSAKNRDFSTRDNGSYDRITSGRSDGNTSSNPYRATNYDYNTGSYTSGETHYGKGPKNYKRSDSRIQEDVSDALTADHHLDASDIEVSVKDGVVTLSGKVSERKMKRYAEDCVENIQGVLDIKNEISTGGLFGNLFSDKDKAKTDSKTESKKLM